METVLILLTILLIILVLVGIAGFYYFIKSKNKKIDKQAKQEIETQNQQQLINQKALQEKIQKLSEDIVAFKTQSESKEKNLFNNLEHLKTATGKMDSSQSSSSEKIAELTKKIEMVNNMVKKNQEGGEKLTTEIEQLNDIFKNSYRRGKLGEASLYFMLESILGKDKEIFKKQHKMLNGKICDAFIFIPNNNIPIDSKFPYDNYLKILKYERQTPEFTQILKRFQSDIKKHIEKIADDYISKADKTAQTVMYLPSQPIFEFLHNEPENANLLNFANKKQIFILGPNNLPSFLGIVSQLWRKTILLDEQNQIQKYLEAIVTEFKRFAERWEKLKRRAEGLTQNVKDFDNTTTKIQKKLEGVKDWKISAPLEKKKILEKNS